MKSPIIKRIARLSALILAMVCIFTAFTPGINLAADEEEKGIVNLFAGEANYSSAFDIGNGGEFAIVFNCLKEVQGIGLFVTIITSQNTEFTVDVHKFETNYETSLKNPVVATAEVPKGVIKENEYLDFMFDKPVPAGEFIVVFHMKGDGFVFKTTYPSYRQRFYDERMMKSFSAVARLYSKDGDKNDAKTVSAKPDLPYIPPMYTFPEDSAVTSMNVNSNAWYMVDGLGRTLPEYSDVGDKKERFVGMFYWTWHDNFSNLKPRNITQITTEFPEAANDWNHVAWIEDGCQNYWNEPIWGYYKTSDPYVLRKNAELLADAGVDVIIFDCTNGSEIWASGFMSLCEVFMQARKEGVRTPQIAFMLNFAATGSSKSAMKKLYTYVYSIGLYQELWFYWEGKPLIMAYNEHLDLQDELEYKIANFFTFRRNESSYFTGDEADKWAWLSMYPQSEFGEKREDGRPEQMAVGVAQNANDHGLTAMNGNQVHGRGYSKGDYSYTYRRNGKNFTATSSMEDAFLYGMNFQQQWDYAIEHDPDFVFVTGWNEWIMGRYRVWPDSGLNPNIYDLNSAYPKNPDELLIVENAFPDEFNDEFSRDIEPSTGVLKDYYYAQLVANIRRYKGMDNVVPQITRKTIDINDKNSWNDVESSFNHYEKSTYDRDTEGFSGCYYTNNTMRNDIVNAKIACDNSNVYFYVGTKDALTPSTDNAWMRLFIDTNQKDNTPNWEGFEYVINRTSPKDGKCTIERSKGVDEDGNWLWEQVGEGEIVIFEDGLAISVKKKLIGVKGSKFQINFKWSDNMQVDGDIMDFYKNGDVAPGSRFAFSSVSYEIKSVAEQAQRRMAMLIGGAIGGVVVLAAAVVAVVIISKQAKLRKGAKADAESLENN